MPSDSILELPPFLTPVELEAWGIFCKRTWWRWCKRKKVKRSDSRFDQIQTGSIRVQNRISCRLKRLHPGNRARRA